MSRSPKVSGEFPPGTRVRFAVPDPYLERGTVLEPTVEDREYFTEQGYPPERNVLVLWVEDGSDREMAAWFAPDELTNLTDQKGTP